MNDQQTTNTDELLRAEARRRVSLALRQIEDAQNMISKACTTLSALNHAAPEWRATSKLHERVKEHWYKVEGALRYGAKANKVCLDSTNTAAFLASLKSSEQQHEG